MKRFLLLAFFFWASLFLYSSTASANDGEFPTYADAWAYCEAVWAPAADPNYCSHTTLQDRVNGKKYSGIYRTYYVVSQCSDPSFQFVGLHNKCQEPPESAQTCEELGLLFDSRIQACVQACPNGMLNGTCLQGSEVGQHDDSVDGNCTVDSSDFQGVFNNKPYCDSTLPEPATCPSGEMQYIVLNENGDGAFTCGTPIANPGDADIQETETTSTVTDAEGNTVTTTTDSNGNTTTTTTNNNGTSTTVNNYAGVDSETGGPCTASSVSCYPADDTDKGFCADGGSLCDDVNDIKKLLEKDSDRTAQNGEFADDQGAGVAAAETALQDGLDQIKSDISGYFDLSLSGGAIVCGEGVQVLGKTISICPSNMQAELVVIGQIVLLIAGLISLMMIFR